MKTNDQEMTNKELQIWIAGELKSFKAEITGELKSFRSHVDGELKSFRAEVNGEIKTVREEIKSLRTEMSLGFAGVDTRMDAVEVRLGSLESRVDGLMIGVAVPVAVFVLLAATKWAWDYLGFLKKFREEKHGLRQSELGLGKSAK